MIVVRNIASLRATRDRWVVSLGRFDGVHLGHQAVIARLAELARSEAASPLVVNFLDGHPAALGSLRQRMDQLAALDVAALCIQRRPGHTRMDVQLQEIVAALHRDLDGLTFVTGASDAPALVSAAQAHRAHVEAVPVVAVDGDPVSSDAIRARIAVGDLAQAERMLGRAYTVAGRVVHGLHRGRTLGFPTANLRVRGLQLPPDGVYAVRFRAGTRVHDGVANLGLNPTFADVERSLETHLFDFDGDLYGRHAEVTFVAHLRGERKFSGIEALVEQVGIDCAEAKRLLS
jgi:riboflavin kinase/FMN adenylyltransferase